MAVLPHLKTLFSSKMSQNTRIEVLVSSSVCGFPLYCIPYYKLFLRGTATSVIAQNPSKTVTIFSKYSTVWTTEKSPKRDRFWQKPYAARTNNWSITHTYQTDYQHFTSKSTQYKRSFLLFFHPPTVVIGFLNAPDFCAEIKSILF